MGNCSPRNLIPRLLDKTGKRAFPRNNGRRARAQAGDLTKMGSWTAQVNLALPTLIGSNIEESSIIDNKEASTGYGTSVMQTSS